jgi:hypothetical protein
MKPLPRSASVTPNDQSFFWVVSVGCVVRDDSTGFAGGEGLAADSFDEALLIFIAQESPGFGVPAP